MRRCRAGALKASGESDRMKLSDRVFDVTDDDTVCARHSVNVRLLVVVVTYFHTFHYLVTIAVLFI